MNTTSAPGHNLQLIQTSDAMAIHDLAHATWFPSYQSILSKEQIDYMLEEIYSIEALEKQLNEGQVFLLLKEQQQPVAFASYSLLVPKTDTFKLNKIYIHPNHQKKGYGLILLDEVAKRCKELGGKELLLNVHRQNPARHFYQKHGFSIQETVDIPFGPFTLNDYIMRRPLV